MGINIVRTESIVTGRNTKSKRPFVFDQQATLMTSSNTIKYKISTPISP